jgi:RNA polymerase sigma-70 factor, ECF subfamily
MKREQERATVEMATPDEAAASLRASSGGESSGGESSGRESSGCTAAEDAELSSSQPSAPANPEMLWARFHEDLRDFIARQVATKADEDDLLQAIYLRIHTALSQTIEPIEIVHPRGWMFQVARSVLYDHLRAKRSKDARSGDVTDEPAVEPDIASVLGDEEEVAQTLIGCMRALLDTLPSPYRDALVWTELENMSQQAAATKAGISIACMKSRVLRGRAYLKDALLSCCDIELDRRRHPMACERRPADADSTTVEMPACKPGRGSAPSCS